MMSLREPRPADCLTNEPTRVGACSDSIKGRKGQHLKLQLRSLRLLSVLSHGAGRDPQVGTGITDSPDHPTLHPLTRAMTRIVHSASRSAKSEEYRTATQVIIFGSLTI